MATENDTEQKAYSIEEVKSVFNELTEAKETQEQQLAEKAKLQEFISDIEQKVESLEKADAENKETIEALNTAISEKEADLEKAGEELAKLQQSLEENQGKLEAAEQKLAEASERELISERIQVLAQKELLRSNEEAQIKQIEKVKGMNDEEFTAHVEELEDIRNQTLAAVSKQEEKKEEVSSDEEEAAEEDTTKIEEVVEKLAEEVASKSHEGGEEASKLIRELLNKAKGKSSTEKATAKNEDTEEVSPKNFESAATVRPTAGNRFAALGQGLAERLQQKN